MFEIRDMDEFEINRDKLLGFPTKVQKKIEDVLVILEEAYGKVEEREFLGGKVVVLENQDDVKQIREVYDLSEYESEKVINTAQGIYLYILLIDGTENNIAIFVEQRLVERDKL